MRPSPRFCLLIVLLLPVALGACGPTPWQKDMAESHLKLGIADPGGTVQQRPEGLMKANELTPDNASIHYFLVAYHSKGLRRQAVAVEKAVALAPLFRRTISNNYLTAGSDAPSPCSKGPG